MNHKQNYKDGNPSDVTPNVIVVVAENSEVSIEDCVVEIIENRNGETSETSAIEKKLDRMNEMLLEQQNILKTLIDGSVMFNCSKKPQVKDSFSGTNETTSGISQENNCAGSLLDNIEQKLAQILHDEFKVAIETLLQSEELKTSVAITTAECLKSEIKRSLAETLQYCFSSMSENYHEMLLDSITDLLLDFFDRLGDDSYLIKSLQNASRSIWHALTKHQTFMESSQPPHNVMKKLQENLESILKRELAESKQSLMNVLKSQATPASNTERVQHSPKTCVPIKPPKPCWNTERTLNQLEEPPTKSQMVRSPESAQSTSKIFVTPKPSKSDWNQGKTQCKPKNYMPSNSVQGIRELEVFQYPAGNKESPGPTAFAHSPPKDKASFSREQVPKSQPAECSIDVFVRAADKPLVNRNGQSLSKPSNPELAQYPVETNEPPIPSQPTPHIEGGKDALNKSISSHPPRGSVLEKMFKAAHIRALIEKGEMEESFREALGGHDLLLVQSACRAADPQRVFAPCCLSQPTLLSLVQQLSTDVTHDTQLKCQYIEECIINLDKTNPTTRANISLIVGEVRKHLSNFLLSHPGHPFSGRITLILMAADNLLL